MKSVVPNLELSYSDHTPTFTGYHSVSDHLCSVSATSGHCLVFLATSHRKAFFDRRAPPSCSTTPETKNPFLTDLNLDLLLDSTRFIRISRLPPLKLPDFPLFNSTNLFSFFSLFLFLDFYIFYLSFDMMFLVYFAGLEIKEDEGKIPSIRCQILISFSATLQLLRRPFDFSGDALNPSTIIVELDEPWPRIGSTLSQAREILWSTGYL